MHYSSTIRLCLLDKTCKLLPKESLLQLLTPKDYFLFISAFRIFRCCQLQRNNAKVYVLLYLWYERLLRNVCMHLRLAESRLNRQSWEVFGQFGWGRNWYIFDILIRILLLNGTYIGSFACIWAKFHGKFRPHLKGYSHFASFSINI